MGGGICSTHFLLSPTQQEEGSKETRREQKGEGEKTKQVLFSSLSFQGAYEVYFMVFLSHTKVGEQ